MAYSHVHENETSRAWNILYEPKPKLANAERKDAKCAYLERKML